MKIRKSFFAVSIIVMLILPAELHAQHQAATAAKPKTASAAGKAEPLRSLSGVMKENRIEVSQSDWINPGKRVFEYRLTNARIVDGRLEFTGSLQETGRPKADVVTATLITTTARSANPWPGATSSTARDRRPAIVRERSEVNEQTQSLYSAVETGSGCELIFLKLIPPRQKTPVQIGVVLAHQDNEIGNQINRALCRVERALDAKGNTDEALKKLNHLIGRE